ncbi:alpha/beta hydrolase [Streptosporangiaceae bacterium NEAU-GS5]|nr:alpha/beta hydrolase [Streptosporangiaceae bacterium NEAU-GS5]
MTHDLVRVSQQDIAYRTSRGDGRPVVFVHGNSSSSRTWTHLLDGDFGRSHRCLAFDLPGHGASPAPKAGSGVYSPAGYAAVLTGFLDALDVRDAVIVGWSLGGHILLEAAPGLPEAAGFVIFGTPPISGPADMPEAFLPNPVLNVGFTPEPGEDDVRAYAAAQLAPGSSLPIDDLVADILAADGAARAELGAGIIAATFADEVEIVATLTTPLAILHGAGDQLVNLDYIRKLSAPSLWRGGVQVIEGAGHTPQEEAPRELAGLLDQFISGLPHA